MHRKTIEQHLESKFQEFLESIEDSHLKKLLRTDTIITGGCIASMLLNEKVNDYDLYLTRLGTVTAVGSYFCRKFREQNPDLNDYPKIAVEERRVKVIARPDGVALKKGLSTDDIWNDTCSTTAKSTLDDVDDYQPVFLSENAITLSAGIQIVLRFYGEPERIHSTYDFVHCMNYWRSRDSKLVLTLDALESLLAKRLVYKGSKYPICSMIRARKFIKRGWSINAGQLLKMAFQISELDLKDVDTLSDQLIGIDTLHFQALIAKMKSSVAGKQKKELSNVCLDAYIDEIF